MSSNPNLPPYPWVGLASGRKWGRPAPTSPMPNKPNADLIGHTFPALGGVVTVTGSAPWNPAYVEVDTEAGPSVRVASQVRRGREIECQTSRIST